MCFLNYYNPKTQTCYCCLRGSHAHLISVITLLQVYVLFVNSTNLCRKLLVILLGDFPLPIPLCDEYICSLFTLNPQPETYYFCLGGSCY